VVGATAGKLNLGIDCAIGRSVAALRPNEFVTTEYLFSWLKPRVLRIRKESRGSAQGVLTKDFLEQMEILLPPIEEQNRIVAKVEELMQLCDDLEARQQARRESRARLNSAVLAPLNKAASLTRKELEQAATRLADNFDALYDSIDTLAKLRSTILQLAVQGKLVTQDPNEEPAWALLQEIGQEQKRLLSEGKIKSIVNLSPMDMSQAPFELPPGWMWSRFPDLGVFNRGRSKHRPRNAPELYVGGQYKLVQTGDVARANGIIGTYTALYNDVGLAQRRMWPAGTMCITIAANIADSGILGFDACFPDSVVGFVPSSIIGSAQYFEYFMRTAKSHLQDFAPSTAQKNINISILQEVLIPLPPLAEQKRIVAKVNQLMSLCDELEAKLRQAEAHSDKLMNAAVKHVLDSVRDASETAEEVFA
jgi:type I restriction enzyme S subunit